MALDCRLQRGMAPMAPAKLIPLKDASWANLLAFEELGASLSSLPCAFRSRCDESSLDRRD